MRQSFPLLLAFLAACGSDQPAPTRLEYVLTADPPSLDPALSTDVQSGEMVALLYDNLVQFDVDARLQPGLATRWEVDSSGRRSILFLSMVFVIVNLMTDILYAKVDPRVAYD
ncbi:MAG TPA: hypothetical protein VM094_05010 [Gemmatimonadales bacterium]|nr:hypothetical protein [Gemmatimonadales bacterium]